MATDLTLAEMEQAYLRRAQVSGTDPLWRTVWWLGVQATHARRSMSLVKLHLPGWPAPEDRWVGGIENWYEGNPWNPSSSPKPPKPPKEPA